MILTAPETNSKLGPKVVSWSRPVGSSCPEDCPFLTGRLPTGEELPAAGLCYASRLQEAVPSVAAAWERNAPGQDWDEWAKRLRVELSHAALRGHAIRIHVGGDVMRPDGKLDWWYVSEVMHAFSNARPRPAAWVYTHAWRQLGAPWLIGFKRLGIEIFASVHSEAEATEARELGYRLAIDGGYMPDGRVPAWREPGVLNCPEQRCPSGSITCSECCYCFTRGKGDVVFFRHFPGAPNYRKGGKHVES